MDDAGRMSPVRMDGAFRIGPYLITRHDEVEAMKQRERRASVQEITSREAEHEEHVAMLRDLYVKANLGSPTAVALGAAFSVWRAFAALGRAHRAEMGRALRSMELDHDEILEAQQASWLIEHAATEERAGRSLAAAEQARAAEKAAMLEEWHQYIGEGAEATGQVDAIATRAGLAQQSRRAEALEAELAAVRSKTAAAAQLQAKVVAERDSRLHAGRSALSACQGQLAGQLEANAAQRMVFVRGHIRLAQRRARGVLLVTAFKAWRASGVESRHAQMMQALQEAEARHNDLMDVVEQTALQSELSLSADRSSQELTGASLRTRSTAHATRTLPLRPCAATAVRDGRRMTPTSPATRAICRPRWRCSSRRCRWTTWPTGCSWST